MPWYTYPVIEYLQQFDFSKLTVFEYGSGNSSCYRFFQVDFYDFAPLVAYTKITTFFISRKCAFPRRSGAQPQKGIGNF